MNNINALNAGHGHSYALSYHSKYAIVLAASHIASRSHPRAPINGGSLRPCPANPILDRLTSRGSQDSCMNRHPSRQDWRVNEVLRGKAKRKKTTLPTKTSTLVTLLDTHRVRSRSSSFPFTCASGEKQIARRPPAALKLAANPFLVHAKRCRLRYGCGKNHAQNDPGRTPYLEGMAPVSRQNRRRRTMVKTVNKHIRIDAHIWDRLDAAARVRNTTANRLLAELATQWLRDREWPLTDVQIQVARASLFTAQAMARDMTAAGREKEIEKSAATSRQSFPMYPSIRRPRTSGTRKLPIQDNMTLKRLLQLMPASQPRIPFRSKLSSLRPDPQASTSSTLCPSFSINSVTIRRPISDRSAKGRNASIQVVTSMTRCSARWATPRGRCRRWRPRRRRGPCHGHKNVSETGIATG